MARFRHISTKLVLVLDAGTEDGKKRRKRVTISNIREGASTDALWELAQALGKLLEYPVAEVRLYKEEAVEREAGDGGAPENGGVQKEADADMARIDGGEAFPMFILRGGDRAGSHSSIHCRVKQAIPHIAAGCRPDSRATARMNSPPQSAPAVITNRAAACFSRYDGRGGNRRLYRSCNYVYAGQRHLA